MSKLLNENDLPDFANINAATSHGASVASDDEVLIADISDSNNIKKTTAQDIADLGGGASSLSDLSDANVSSPTAGQSLLYHATNSQFENATITAGDGLTRTTGDASLTLDVGGGTGITANADDIQITSGGVTSTELDESTSPTWTGPHDFSGGTLTLPTATGPSQTTEGQVQWDSDDDRLTVGDGSSTQVIDPVKSKAITIESPGTSEDITMFEVGKAVTITEMRAVIRGSSTPDVTWTIRHNTDRSATGNEVVTGGTTTSSTTSGDTITTFDDATIAADSWVWLETTANSGTVDELNVTIKYTID